MNCKNHSDKVAAYHCTNCQGYFCEPCTVIRKVSDDFTAYICKECGGRVEQIIDKNAQRKTAPAKSAKPAVAKVIESTKPQTFAHQEGVLKVSTVRDVPAEVLNFWFYFPEALIFPLKGKGIFSVVSFAALFFAIAGIERLAPGANLPLFLVMGTYFAVYLFKASEDSFYGSARIQHLPRGPYWAEMGRVLISLLCAVVLYLFPAHIYFVFRSSFDGIYFLLLILGLFLFPMAVVRIIIARRIIAASPLGVAASIAKTFFAYVWLTILLIGFFALTCYLNSEYLSSMDGGRALWWLLCVYLNLVIARLLGTFARAYSGRINLKARQK